MLEREYVRRLKDVKFRETQQDEKNKNDNRSKCRRESPYLICNKSSVGSTKEEICIHTALLSIFLFPEDDSIGVLSSSP